MVYCIKLDKNVELARAVDIMMVQAKRSYILMIKINKAIFFPFFVVKVWKNEKAVETLACGWCSHSISRSPKLSLMFLLLDRNTVHVFYFLNKCNKGGKFVLNPTPTPHTHTNTLPIFFSPGPLPPSQSHLNCLDPPAS